MSLDWTSGRKGEQTTRGDWPHQQTTISSESEKRSLLGEMVRFENQLGLPGWKWQRILYGLTIVLPTRWVVVRLEEPLQPRFADYWACEHGEWTHSTRRGPHEELGMAFAWWAMRNTVLENLDLADSPDIRGKYCGKPVVGDVGQCSPWAFITGLRCVGFHSLWISVLDKSTQVLLEFRYSPSAVVAYNLRGGFTSESERQEAIKTAFWCPDHAEWVLAEEDRKQFWRTLRPHPVTPEYKSRAMTVGMKRKMRRRKIRIR